MRRKLSWPLRPGVSAWNKGNGFFLVDVLVACSIVLLLVIPILRLSYQSMRSYAEAAMIQQSAMIAREVMERHRQAGMAAAGVTVYERQGRSYTVTVSVIPKGERYICYIVEVEDESGRMFRCKRLERAAT